MNVYLVVERDETGKVCERRVPASDSDKSVPIVPMDNIFRASVSTKDGNMLQFFYNPDNNLVVVDIANDNGGNELLRKTLDEKKLLSHTL